MKYFQGYNGDIVYEIVHGDQQSQFSIDNKTGELVVAGVLDREMISNYGRIRVTAAHTRGGIILYFHNKSNTLQHSNISNSILSRVISLISNVSNQIKVSSFKEREK